MTRTSNQDMSQNTKNRTMLYMRDTSISFPELWMSVYISGPPIDAVGFPEMFARSRCYKATTPENADLVVFTGGADVSPALYTNQSVHKSVYSDVKRDEDDLKLYSQCYEQGIPMFGVCRGAQFGHVMNGGELYQDVDGHNGGNHNMYTIDNSTIRVSSVHHQMCVENKQMDLLGWSNESRTRYVSGSMVESGAQKDVEAFFYADSCFFGVQGHPEYKGNFSFAHWCLNQIQELIVNNPYVTVHKDRRLYRLQESFLAQRENERKQA